MIRKNKNYSILKKRGLVWLILFLIIFSPVVSSAGNYQINPSSFDAFHQKTTSSHYQLEGSVEPIIGLSKSSNYRIESGSSFPGYCGDGFIDINEDCEGNNLNGQTCQTLGFSGGDLYCQANCLFDTSHCTSAGGGGGGGGIILKPDPPSFDQRILAKSFTYLDKILVFGYKPVNVPKVYVNGSPQGVIYPTSSRWQKLVSLELGENKIVIKSKNEYGFSKEVSHTIFRRIPGDINNDNRVNDYDFSLLANHWEENWPEADFNEDRIVNDYDLSLMAVHWTD